MPENEMEEFVSAMPVRMKVKPTNEPSAEATREFDEFRAKVDMAKPNWMAIRMSVLRGDRTKAELRTCGCDQCKLALDFMKEANE